MQITVERHMTPFSPPRSGGSNDGISACSECTVLNALYGPTRNAIPTTWEASSTAFTIGRPGLTLLRVGTLPGDPFSSLQARLRDGLTMNGSPKPLLFGYTNGYLGYFADDAAPAQTAASASTFSMTYGVVQCDGPTYFQNAQSLNYTPNHTPGTQMVDGLLGAF
jgi:hypothetical protein